MTIARPDSIAWFERLYLGSLLIGAIQSAATWEEATKAASPVFLLTTMVFTFGLIITLTLLVSRGRSNVAKWINVVLFGLGLPFTLYLLATEPLNRWALVGLVQTAMQGAGLWLLFTASAREWLERKTPPLPSAPDLRRTFE